MTRSDDTVLRIEHLSKTFAGQAALFDVGIEIHEGEVHALVGQNGSGKSTLIKVLAGYHQPDEGATAWSRSTPLTLGDGHAAADAGIRFVHQDLGLVGSLDTVDNIAIVNGYDTGRGAKIRWGNEVQRARAAMEALGLDDIDVRAPVASLPPAQRTAVAIARAIEGWEEGIALLVLDEPTATMPADDVHRLFDIVRRLKERGVAILYVSHHLDEVFELADRVTVLRDGKRVTTCPTSDLDYHDLVELIVGHPVEFGTVTEDDTDRMPPMLVAEGLSGGALKPLDLTVRPGEIVGIAGITGSGRELVLPMLAGQTPSTEGTIELDGEELANYRPDDGMAKGIAFVPSERARWAAIPTMVVRENATISDVGRFFRRFRMQRTEERDEVADWTQRLSIKAPSAEAAITALSGGNQQKVIFARALRLSPKLLLLDEPTQGIDVGAKDQIHQLVDEAAARGVAVLVSTSDTEELVRLCHRVVVLANGENVLELSGPEVTVERISHAQLQTAGMVS